jgi:hypothetical protein
MNAAHAVSFPAGRELGNGCSDVDHEDAPRTGIGRSISTSVGAPARGGRRGQGRT